MNFDREQLEALKKQIEEDYRLDMAAIERLSRRYQLGNNGGRPLGSAGGAGVTPAQAFVPPAVESRPEPIAASASAPVIELPQDRKPDELTGTLRAMFSSVR